MVHRILLKLSLHPLYRYTFGHYLQSWGSRIYMCLTFRIILQKWVAEAPEEDLHLPKPNIFIPRDLSLKNIEEKVTLWKTCLLNIVLVYLALSLWHIQVSVPFMLRKTPFSRLWYKPDTMFFTPKAYIKMDFHCPLSQSSPESAVLTDVFTRLLMDYLNDYGM